MNERSPTNEHGFLTSRHPLRNGGEMAMVFDPEFSYQAHIAVKPWPLVLRVFSSRIHEFRMALAIDRARLDVVRNRNQSVGPNERIY